MLCLLPASVTAQVRITHLRVPPQSCAGSEQTVRIGYRPTNEVVIGYQEATLGHSDLIFLPDGVECDGTCSYRSPVTFTAFAEGDSITSAQDIKYIRLNIEHSYIGDIYINLTCPNGQKADLMRFAGSGSSSCNESIPTGSRNWLSGDNMSESVFFGNPIDNSNDSYPCNSNAPGNQAGTGWNYCWSSNTTSGYSYASGDGIIYRSGHAHNGHVDSSNVAAHTNFYHPDDNFSRLVGCPLNGTWYIEVVDGFSQDNGYIFEWEMSLDASLIPNDCLPVAYGVEGAGSERLDDSTFVLHAPEALTSDSTVNYRYYVVTSCGDTIDTNASVVYHPNRDTSMTAVACEGVGYQAGFYHLDSAGHYDLSFNTVHGCDSVVHLDLGLYPSYDLHTYDSTCLNVPYRFDDSTYTHEGTFVHAYRTVYGCDSLRTLHLHIASPYLKADFRAYPLICDYEHEVINLKDNSLHSVSSRWMIDGTSTSQPEMTLTYPIERDSLIISLEAMSNEGCFDTATVIARYDRSTVFVPNAFTPTMDQNTEWRPVLRDVVESEVWIYNRMGALVAQLEGVVASWDGGTCPQGVYTYTVHYRSRVRPEWKQVMKGTVLLIR